MLLLVGLGNPNPNNKNNRHMPNKTKNIAKGSA